jgi:hypothetical protein
MSIGVDAGTTTLPFDSCSLIQKLCNLARALTKPMVFFKDMFLGMGERRIDDHCCCPSGAVLVAVLQIEPFARTP